MLFRKKVLFLFLFLLLCGCQKGVQKESSDLQPTSDQLTQTDAITITFGVNRFGKNSYQNAVTEFNKKNPMCQIELKTYDYYDDRLLSQLITGKGPVLLDSELVGFEDNKAYWEPLDRILEQPKLSKALIPEVVNLGKIDETLYGIASNFTIYTVISGRQSPTNWTYDEFLKCIENDSNLEGIFYGSSLDDGEALIARFFLHEKENNYLFDPKSKTTAFDTDAFRKILRFGKKYQGRRCGFEKLKDGTLLCMNVEINKPQHISFIRVLLGDNANYIGYPTKSGSTHYLFATPLVVCTSANDAEKEIAYRFLESLLSYDIQKDSVKEINFGMSVRSDVLEEQIKNINTLNNDYIFGLPQIQLTEEQIDYKKDSKTLYDLLKKAKPYRTVPKDLANIIMEEVSPYFSDDVSEDTAIGNLESRVGLYLQEQP